MKLKYTLTLICSLFIYAGFSQIHLSTMVWSAEGTEIISDAKRYDDGSIYVAGRFTEATDFDHSDAEVILEPIGVIDVYVAKYSHFGELIWVHSFGAVGEAQNKLQMQLDDEGNAFLSGVFDGEVDFDFSAEEYVLDGNNEVYLLKINADGEFQFAYEFNVYEGPMQLDKEGNVLMVGQFFGIKDFNPGAEEFYLDNEDGNRYFLKLNNAGEFVWAKNVGESENPFFVDDIGVNSNNEIYLTGNFTDTLFYVVDGTENYSVNEDVYGIGLIKYDSDAEILWGGALLGEGANYATDIAIDRDDNIIIGGLFTEELDFDFGAGATIETVENRAMYIQKLSSDHELLWYGIMPTNGSITNCYFNGIVTDQYNDIYFAGDIATDFIDFDPGVGTDNRSSWDDQADAFFGKWSADGTYIWAKTIGRVGNDRANSIFLDEVGTIYLAGGFSDNCDFDPNDGTYFIDALGYPDGYLSRYYQGLTGIEPTPVFDGLSVYPNPTAGTFTISGLTAGDQVEVYSLNGELLIQNQAMNINHEISLAHLADGVYLVKVVNKASSRMVKVVKG